MGKESYEDLDEVVAHFVEPLTARYKEVRGEQVFAHQTPTAASLRVCMHACVLAHIA